jgi:hypothetical protein
MLEQMREGYDEAVDDGVSESDLNEHRPESVRVVLREATSRSWKQLARERIEDEKPAIPLGKRFWPLSAEERAAIGDLFATEPLRRLATALRSRDDDVEVEVRDAAYWMKGCSSLWASPLRRGARSEKQKSWRWQFVPHRCEGGNRSSSTAAH